jgi:hypothetical protein
MTMCVKIDNITESRIVNVFESIHVFLYFFNVKMGPYVLYRMVVGFTKRGQSVSITIKVVS